MYPTQDTNFNRFYTPLGKIRSNGSAIEYHIYPNVQWVVKNYGKTEEKWYSQVRNPKWGLREYSLDQRTIERFKNAMEEQAAIKQQQTQFYSQINKPLANVNPVDFPKSAAFTIYQHEYGITTAKSRMPILGTWAAADCVILALYDNKNKIAALAHIDAMEVKSLANIFKYVDVESTVAHLYGGSSALSFDKCLDIIEFIKSSGLKIENCALIEHSNGCASLAIDARNGKLYSPVEPHHLTPCDNVNFKIVSSICNLSQELTPLNKGYDGFNDLCEG